MMVSLLDLETFRSLTKHSQLPRSLSGAKAQAQHQSTITILPSRKTPSSPASSQPRDQYFSESARQIVLIRTSHSWHVSSIATTEPQHLPESFHACDRSQWRKSSQPLDPTSPIIPSPSTPSPTERSSFRTTHLATSKEGSRIGQQSSPPRKWKATPWLLSILKASIMRLQSWPPGNCSSVQRQ